MGSAKERPSAMALLAVVSWLLTRALLLFPLRGDSNDVRIYFAVADEWLKGTAPYAGALFEYPPGAAVLAVVPRLFVADASSYPFAFALWMLCFDAINAALVFLLCRAEGTAPVRAWLGVLAYALASAALGELSLQRYDQAVATAILAALFVVRRRPRFFAEVLLGVGALLKLVPVVLLPLVLWLRFRAATEPTTPSARSAVRWLAQEGWRGIAAFVVTVLVGLSFFFDNLDGVRASLAFQSERGVQIESTWASALMLIDRIVAPLDLSESFSHGASHLTGALTGEATAASTVALPLALVVTAILLVWRKRDLGDRFVVEGATSILLAVLCFSKVLSPQFFLWVIPLLAIMAARTERPPALVSMSALALLLSGFLLLAAYGALQELDPIAIVMLCARNGLLVALWWSVTWRRPAVARAPRARSVALTIGLLAVLAVDLNYREVTDSDFWLHRAVGNDILATGIIPTIDSYSATASGAEFVAHEWLSAIALASVDGALGSFGLFLVRTGSVFLIAVLMVCALSRRMRRTFVVIPLAVLSIVVVEMRADVRPHLLALVVIAVFSLLLSRWRRRGRWAPLLWLIPLHALWANLHGSVFLGPGLLWLLGGVALVAPIRRRRVWRARVPLDALQLFVAGGAAFFACMLNPRGPRLLSFAFDLAFRSDFIHGFIDEWRGTLEVYTPSAQMIAYIMMLAVGWLALAVGGASRARPIQLAVAIVVTWLSVRSVRFHAEAAVLLFPIALERLWCAVERAVRRAGAQDVRTSPVFDGALVLTVCLFGVFAYQDDLGTGYDRSAPRAAVEILRARHARVVFNEYEDGGFLIDQLRPDLKVVMDGRIDVYGPDRLHTYRIASKDMAAFDAYVAVHDVDAVLLGVGVGVPNLPLYQHLRAASSTWTLVHDGERHVLFLRVDLAETRSQLGSRAQ